MKIETYQCDVCGKQKGETNHWWRVVANLERKIAVVQGLGQHFYPEWRGAVHPAQAASAYQLEVQSFHLCGQDCVTKKLSELMKG